MNISTKVYVKKIIISIKSINIINTTVTIDINMITKSDLSSLTDQTPTLLGTEAPHIQALIDAVNDAQHQLAYDRLPSSHRVRIKGINYVRYNPYRSSKSKRTVWYWDPSQAEELFRASKGMASQHLY